MDADAVVALDALAVALRDERRALVENDASALVSANAAKLSALKTAQSLSGMADMKPRVTELAELNRANGALLARRQREVRWALRRLGRVESGQGYGSNGKIQVRATSRVLGSG